MNFDTWCYLFQNFSLPLTVYESAHSSRQLSGSVTLHSLVNSIDLGTWSLRGQPSLCHSNLASKNPEPLFQDTSPTLRVPYLNPLKTTGKRTWSIRPPIVGHQPILTTPPPNSLCACTSRSSWPARFLCLGRPHHWSVPLRL